MRPLGGGWKLGQKKDQASHAFAVAKGIVQEVYVIEQWHPAGATEYETRLINNAQKASRWEFTGKVALEKIRSKYIGNSVAHYFTRGQANPLCYVGHPGDEVPQFEETFNPTDDSNEISIDMKIETTVQLRELSELRHKLVETALAWEQAFGNAPAITSALSELDAALLMGCSEEHYSTIMSGATAVRKGYDFKFSGKRYQVKANRPSGKSGSFVNWVPKAKNYEWDYLIWVLYNTKYQIQEAWLWEVRTYKDKFDSVKRLSPEHYREGKRLR